MDDDNETGGMLIPFNKTDIRLMRTDIGGVITCKCLKSVSHNKSEC